MPSFTLTEEQFSALSALARRGVEGDEERTRSLDKFLREIEESNGVTRYFLLVRWQELDQPLPPGTNFPETWPPVWQRSLERTDRDIARAEVDTLVSQEATNPTSILVTRDPSGVLGWKTLDQHFGT